MYFTWYQSKIARILLVGSENGLNSLLFENGKHFQTTRINPDWLEDSGPFDSCIRQLDEYFAGERQSFDLSLNLDGTPFQRRVWDELTRIPYGETISYAELANRIRQPGASRAVGSANGKNPISIIVPCHRVISSNDRMAGYGGGLTNKVELLRLEGLEIEESTDLKSSRVGSPANSTS